MSRTRLMTRNVPIATIPNVRLNSYMLAHGTRPAASPRSTRPTACIPKPSQDTATAMLAARRTVRWGAWPPSAEMSTAKLISATVYATNEPSTSTVLISPIVPGLSFRSRTPRRRCPSRRPRRGRRRAPPARVGRHGGHDAIELALQTGVVAARERGDLHHATARRRSDTQPDATSRQEQRRREPQERDAGEQPHPRHRGVPPHVERGEAPQLGERHAALAVRQLDRLARAQHQLQRHLGAVGGLGGRL